MFDPPVPLAFHPDMEKEEAGEAETAKALLDTMHGISERTYKDGGHAIRSVHAKSHGLLEGELEIFADLPEVLKQGLAAKPGKHPVVMRFSTVPGDILDDSVSAPRGLAIKILGVEGERLPGSEGATTQDLVMVNGPSFSAPNAKVFLANLKLLAGTTDNVEGLKKVMSGVLRGAEHVVEQFGVKSPTLLALGGQPETHILGDRFHTQVPVRYGAYIAKLSVAPASPALKALTEAPMDFGKDPDALRHAVSDFFGAQGGEWDLLVQFAIDHEHTPIEDAHKVWPEDRSPYIPIGRITALPQTTWSEARSASVDDGMSFSPWHGLAAHKPLGSVMRVRKAAYEMSARFRGEHNGRPVAEPTSASLPG